MLIYNVTVKIDANAEQRWLNYMQKQHLADVMATGMFLEFRMSKIQVMDEEGGNYSIQYLCKDQATLERYQEEFAPALQKEHTELFKDQFVAFRTILEVIDHNSNI